MQKYSINCRNYKYNGYKETIFPVTLLSILFFVVERFEEVKKKENTCSNCPN